MKVIYNKKYEKNAPLEEPTEHKEKNQDNDNISPKELLVIFIISSLTFPVLMLVRNIIMLF